MKHAIFYIALVMAFVSRNDVNGQASEKKDKSAQKKEDYQKVLSIIESGKYEFDAQKANPQRGRQIDLTTNPGFLRINNGHARADLPYMGVAQTAPYSGDVGIKFDSEATSYKVTKNEKKNKITVTFKVNSKGESFNCTLSIAGGTGNASLYIISTRRDSISYYGVVSELKE